VLPIASSLNGAVFSPSQDHLARTAIWVHPNLRQGIVLQSIVFFAMSYKVSSRREETSVFEGKIQGISSTRYSSVILYNFDTIVAPLSALATFMRYSRAPPSQVTRKHQFARHRPCLAKPLVASLSPKYKAGAFPSQFHFNFLSFTS
jgi:hypothetical protein